MGVCVCVWMCDKPTHYKGEWMVGWWNEKGAGQRKTFQFVSDRFNEA